MTFTCPVNGCQKELNRFQVMHFRHTHDLEPWEWVAENHGQEIYNLYTDGYGCYEIAERIDSPASDGLVESVVGEFGIKRNQEESVSGEMNPMKRNEVAEQFTGENNPAKRDDVSQKISDSLSGQDHYLSGADPEEHPMYGYEFPEDHGGWEIDEEGRANMSATQKERFEDPAEREKAGRGQRGSPPPEGSGWCEWYSLDEEIDWYERDDKVQGKLELRVARQLSRVFGHIDTQVTSVYTVDFRVAGVFIEVKGWLKDSDIQKGEEMISHGHDYIVIGAEEDTSKIPADEWFHVSEIDRAVSYLLGRYE